MTKEQINKAIEALQEASITFGKAHDEFITACVMHTINPNAAVSAYFGVMATLNMHFLKAIKFAAEATEKETKGAK